MSPATPSPVVPPPRDRNPTLRLQTLFVLALGTIACTALLSPILFQREIAAQAAATRLIEQSGRQRALSQSLCKVALQLQPLPPEARPARAATLRELLATGGPLHAGR